MNLLWRNAKDVQNVEINCFDRKKESKQKAVDGVLQELQGKQVFIRTLLSKGNETLVSEIGDVFENGSHYRSNVRLDFTQREKQLKGLIDEENDKFAKKLAQIISQHVRKYNLSKIWVLFSC